MKKCFLTLVLLITALFNAQSKDFTKKDLLKSKSVKEYSRIYNISTESTFNMVKCQKELLQLKRYKDTPFISGKNKSKFNEEEVNLLIEECQYRTLHPES